DENLVRALWQIDGIVIRQAEEDGEHSDVHVDQISHSLAQHRPGVTRELLPPLEQHQVKSLFRAEVLVNELLDLAQQLTILENRELHVENGRFLGSGVLLGTGANLPQTRPRL